MDLTGRTIEQIRFDALIGRGGMGAVYRGFDLRLKRPVAVKVLRDHSRRAPEARGRFMREARLLSRLDHPGICRVYDLIPRPQGNLLVLELIEGRTVRELGAESWPLEKQLEVARDIADALASAHRQLILHRDLKPDNVMLTEGGQVKLLDFGIARPISEQMSADGPPALDGELDLDEIQASREDDEITLFAGAFGAFQEPRHAKGAADGGETFHTLRGATVGTVAYMSPEQALGHDLTVASDMYAFGVLMQELFTGRRAYARVSLLELFQLVARAETAPIEGLDPDLRQLIRQLEDRDPAGRPSAEEARDRLQALIDRPALRRQRRRRLIAGLAALLLVAVAVGAIVYSRLESRRQAALAERFAQQASAVEWLLRAEHLSPTHDVTPARSNIEAQLERLAAELPRTRRFGRAAGNYALGRAHLALDQLKPARAYLQQAWDGGYRLPEVESYLGLAMVRLHARENEKARRIPSADQRRAKLEELDAELRRPGVERLKSGRFAGAAQGRSPVLSIEPRHYPQALVAFGEGRLDEALEQAARAAATWPWFYEALLLKAQVEIRRALELQAEGDSQSQEALERARDHAAAAAEAARSDPRVATEQCLIEVTMLDLDITRPRLGEQRIQEIFQRGQAACRRALAIDPQNARALALLARLMQRGAEASAVIGEGEQDLRTVLAEAAGFAERALVIDGDDAPAWKTLGDIHSMQADWAFFHGVDPAPSVEKMHAAYQQAVRLLPAESRYVNALGNAQCFLGEIDAKAGRDPRPMLQAAAQTFRRSDQLSASAVEALALINLAICTMPAIRYELQVGLDPAARIEQAQATLEVARRRDASPFRLWRQIGELWIAEAVRRMQLGPADAGGTREALEQARMALDRALELNAPDLHSSTSALELELVSALAAGEPGDHRAAITAAAAWVERILDKEPTWQPALLAAGRLARLRAGRALARGVAADGRAISDGRAAVETALERDPSNVEAWLELGRLELAASALEDAASALLRAKSAFDEAARLWPERPDVQLALAATEHRRAQLGGEAAAEHAADRSRQLRARALDLRAGLTDVPAPESWLAGATFEGQLRWLP